MPRGPGSIQKKILLALLGGASLLFASASPSAFARTLRQINREFAKFKARQIANAIRALYRSKLTDYREKPDGTVRMTLSAAGKERALTYNVDTMRIPVPPRWDKKWRLVVFDIPHDLKQTRDAFRFHLKRLGFYQFQKSVFVLPYPCEDELNFLVELHDIRPFVRLITATSIDNEFDLRERFHIS